MIMTKPLTPDGWFIENHEDNYAQGFAVTKHLHHEQTPYQVLDIYDTIDHGRLMVLDGFVMLTDAHEFPYHEMLTHVPLLVHPEPARVLVIGGGDGGCIREMLRHPEVKKATMCEIDEAVTVASQKYFPYLTEWIDGDSRGEARFADGIAYIKENPGAFDVIVVDSTDPIGPAKGLFNRSFYNDVKQALKPGGIVAVQGESYWYFKEELREMLVELGAVFDHLQYYTSEVPCYPGTVWGMGIASMTDYDFRTPHDPQRARAIAKGSRYYTPDMHRAAFIHPAFANNLIKDMLK